MSQIGIPYELIGPDGTRAVFGNHDTALADPDYIGLLDPENGVTGLLDSADVRESAADLVEGDGGVHGPFFHGRRAGTFQGIIDPNVDVAFRNTKIAKLKRACRAMRLDAYLRWTPDGDSVQRQLRVRRSAAGPPRISGRFPKVWQIGLVSEQAFIESAQEFAVTITPGAPAGETGLTDPLLDPIQTSADVTAAADVFNGGDAEAWPRFRIDGPISNPEILNNTTGEKVRLNYTLAVDEYLEVVPRVGAILLDGVTDRYSALDFAASQWWQLEPGNNDVRLLATSYAAGAELTITYRYAWE